MAPPVVPVATQYAWLELDPSIDHASYCDNAAQGCIPGVSPGTGTGPNGNPNNFDQINTQEGFVLDLVISATNVISPDDNLTAMQGYVTYDPSVMQVADSSLISNTRTCKTTDHINPDFT